MKLLAGPNASSAGCKPPSSKFHPTTKDCPDALRFFVKNHNVSKANAGRVVQDFSKHATRRKNNIALGFEIVVVDHTVRCLG